MTPGDFPKKHEARRIPRTKIFAHDPELRRALGIMLRGFRAEHRRHYKQMRDGIVVTFPEHTWFWHVRGGRPRDGQPYVAPLG